MRFHVITIFPNIFDSYLGESILKHAIAKKIIRVFSYDIRKFSKDKHHTVDGRPYGGGVGMVLKALPIVRTVEATRRKIKKGRRVKVVLFSAKGKALNQKTVYRWAKDYDDIILISGRYEGVDERVRIILKAEEISIGPYVLTDGEVPAMVIISAVSRLIPGVIRPESLEEESHWSKLIHKEGTSGKDLEYPHYTRPEILEYCGKKYRVPKILLSGDHKKIEAWRKAHQK
ncbi:tRNA (guanosine(37)-N1)-methyltransferase TrmD [Patescibacteria group bacterium]|nr:tRNA (guanosine(37)-N1)-methyltransferase TrmD [Patescibacteria group bacterium]